jgi:predicted outer membrane repeat protein
MMLFESNKKKFGGGALDMVKKTRLSQKGQGMTHK